MVYIKFPDDLHFNEAGQELVGNVANSTENMVELDQQKLSISLQLILQLFCLWLTST